MSFIENNKAWILPLLGLGAASVIWLNVRTFNQAPAATQDAPQPAAAAPISEAPAETPPPSTQDEALWEDLRPVAFVPAVLEARAPFEQKALSVLPPLAYEAPKPVLIVRPLESEPRRESRRTAMPGHGTPLPVPPPDFLIDGPDGAQAWFDGQGYRTGQSLKGRPFLVKGITLTPKLKATLQGSPGSASDGTRPTPVQEVP